MAIVSLTFFPDRFSLVDVLYRTDQQKFYKNAATFAAPNFIDLGANIGSGTTFPATHDTAIIFWHTVRNALYKNIGTEGTPVWRKLNNAGGVGLPVPSSPFNMDLFSMNYFGLLQFWADENKWWHFKDTVFRDILADTFQDDYNTDGYLDQHAARIGVDDVTNERLDFDIRRDDSNDASSFDLDPVIGGDLDGSLWTIDFSLTVTTLDQGSSSTAIKAYISVSDLPSSSDSEQSPNSIGLKLGVGSTQKLFSNIFSDDEVLGANTDNFSAVISVTTFYVRMVKRSATQMKVELHNDRKRSSASLIESSTTTVGSGIANLRYFGIWNQKTANSGADAQLIGYIDDLEVYNNIDLTA